MTFAIDVSGAFEHADHMTRSRQSKGSVWLILPALGAFSFFASAQARTFQDRAGHKIEAEIQGVTGGSVTLLTSANAKLVVPLANFAVADQAFITDWEKSKSPPPTAAASDRQPGAIVQFDFPELPADQNGKPAACRIRLPDDYDSSKPMPLLLWFGGGKGTSSPEGALDLVDQTKFAVAAMPYPSNVPSPRDALAAGKMDEIWKYHAVMLKKLIESFPNLDPKIRAVAGFSNGAHTIGSYISDGRKEFTDFFHAYIIIEGGSPAPNVHRPLHGGYAFLAWGDAAGNSKDYMGAMVGAAKAARLKTTTFVMTGAGHQFTAGARTEARKWLETTVIPQLAKQP